MTTVKHTVMRNGGLFCTHCGESKALANPMEMTEMIKSIDSFNGKHRKCKKTWVEPVANTQGKTESENALWWLANGEHGISSETMFKYLSDNIEIPFDKPESHPYDPDDFRRCYLLLEAIPQFKDKLWRLINLSPTWENLVNNWAKLSQMLEEQMRTKQKNGMYEFMQTLIVK